MKRKQNRVDKWKTHKILQEKKQSESFECSGKKAKLTTKRLVVFRKKVKSSYFGDSFGTAKIESVNKFWTNYVRKKRNVYLVITKQKLEEEKNRSLDGIKKKKKTKNIRNILVIYFETKAWNNIN